MDLCEFHSVKFVVCQGSYRQRSLLVLHMEKFNVALKISKTIGVIARLRHFVPLCTLLNIYRSLIFPYLSYGLAAWGQAAKTHLQKLLVLQKRVLRLMYFSEPISLQTFSP